MSEPHNPLHTIFAEALEIADAQERETYLSKACGQNLALRREVLELILAGGAAGKFLPEKPATDAARAALAGASEALGLGPATAKVSGTAVPGDRIGRYKLLQQIGEGGCGVVYMAEQQEPVKRHVALKVIKPGMDSRQVLARFEAERQALALMDHPNIAKILEAGSTADGYPFFVMELVRGIRLTEYCDQHNLSTRQRLELFTKICGGVQHAHQKGIIHRDIKPSNILVTVQEDGSPVPKIIDFGIAKATAGQTLTDKTVFTAFEQFIGTPAYMSPEQAAMTAIDIDTRSDIYSLGVLLYELLTGRTPFDSKRLVEAGFDEIRRIIREEDPPRPSTRLGTLSLEEQTTVAKRRKSDPPKLIYTVRGDLDWIVMKALEKDRTRRYETANGLARDIERHLSQEPVAACPPSNLYRFRKLVRRNRLVFTAAGAVAAALVAGLAVSTWMFVREREAKAEQVTLRLSAQAQQSKAQTEAAKSDQVARFLEDMLKGVGPSVAWGRDTSILREILAKAADRAGKQLTNQPEVEAELRNTMGEVYAMIHEGDKAEQMYRKALEIGRRLPGGPHACLARSLHDLGWVVWSQHRLWGQPGPNKLAEAEACFREALGIRRKLYGKDNPDIANSLLGLSFVLHVQPRKLTEAEAAMREALAMQLRRFGNESPEVAECLQGLAYLCADRGDLVEAERSMREALAIQRKFLTDYPWTSVYASDLAFFLLKREKFEEAESLCREAIELKKSLHLHEEGMKFERERLSIALEHQGKLEEAEAVQRELVESLRQGRAKSALAGSLRRLGDLLLRRQKTSEAETTYAEAREVLRSMTQEAAPARPGR